MHLDYPGHILFHVQSNLGQVASPIASKNYWTIDRGRIESLALTFEGCC
jgi:hypothetical protein